jgi:hypothetical protein
VTALLLMLLLTALAGVVLLAAVHAWYPRFYVQASTRMAGWCTLLTMLALILRNQRWP